LNTNVKKTDYYFEERKPLIAVSAIDTLKILIRKDGAPGMHLGKDGQVHGFYVDLEKKVMAEMGQSYEFIQKKIIGILCRLAYR
jgi:hypothetical protein